MAVDNNSTMRLSSLQKHWVHQRYRNAFFGTKFNEMIRKKVFLFLTLYETKIGYNIKTDWSYFLLVFEKALTFVF